MYKIRIPYSEVIIKVAFFIFIFFTFFPSSEPFPAGRQEIGVENMSESNPLNQIIKLSVFFLTFLSSIYKFDEIIIFIKKEKYLFLFLLWALLSIFWSNFPMVTFKRWFQIFLIYYLFITFLVYFDENEIIKIIKPILYLYLIATIFSVLFIPGAKDLAFNTWRGFSPTKNTLGQIGVISSVLSLIIYLKENLKIKKYIALFFLLLSIVIVLGTLSSTSYIALFIFLSGTALYWLNTKFLQSIGAGKTIFILSLSFSVVLFLIISVFMPQLTDYIQGIFGKSETFYDRGKLWTVMLWHFGQHPLIGCGYQAFWTIENPQLLLLYQTFVWLPNQAHNGYLDILNEVGIVGFVLFMIMILKNIVSSFKEKLITPWLWFFILPLIINVTESNFYRPGIIITTFIILSYLIIEKINNYSINY
ncbi:MAG: O-antigen ligase family protein [Ignavibacterium album]|uniref:O-antigen ligase family protein n=1 Tax=Ignavibacterium album TaxID=591197 RepID=UPI0026EE0ECE|nr:O-antigen ligase family protein [Ignavibacterium album]MBI5661136.1 O-antigen ligase family protein [Ignavibacterium album]